MPVTFEVKGEEMEGINHDDACLEALDLSEDLRFVSSLFYDVRTDWTLRGAQLWPAVTHTSRCSGVGSCCFMNNAKYVMNDS